MNFSINVLHPNKKKENKRKVKTRLKQDKNKEIYTYKPIQTKENTKVQKKKIKTSKNVPARGLEPLTVRLRVVCRI